MKTSAAMLISSTPCTISLQKAASRLLRLCRSSSRSTSELSLTEEPDGGVWLDAERSEGRLITRNHIAEREKNKAVF